MTTPTGGYEGKVETTPGGAVQAFLGIPYAQPPVGERRWKAPAAAASWTGVRPFTSFGSRCMQPSLYDDMFFRDPGQSEDCLTLNVWRTAKPGGRLPVMLWIHGGGFATGGSSEPRQDGGHLATKGVILVTFNYRLGVFGFMAHPELAGENATHAAGNYGLLDAVAALTWVHAHIASFGGDPGNVTIFGESAGSTAVSALMASPLAHGLFAHAIGESGGAFGMTRALPAAERGEKDAEFARTVLHADSLAALRAIPAEQLLAEVGAAHHGFGMDIDGAFLPQAPAQIFAQGRQNDVPMIAGWNHDEGGSGKGTTTITPTGGASAPAAGVDAPGDLARLKETAEKDFGPRASEFLAAFPATSDAEALTRLQEYAAAKFIAYGTWSWLEAQATYSKSPAYRYRFDLVPPPDPARPGRFGVFHSDDIEYVFGNLDSRKGIAWRPEDYAMSEQMMTYWTNFARTGDPNGGGKQGALPRWPVYNAASGSRVMYLNQTSVAEKDATRDEFLFLRSAQK
ncbi:MAG TPA: carboxylesterase family protein [Acidobacteriaceae bacterium]